MLSLQLLGDVPLHEGDVEKEVRLMNRRSAEEHGGKLSYPSKMDCPSWGIPAKYCRVGSALSEVEGSTCSDCYALKGTFRFGNVAELLEQNFRKMFSSLWVPAMVALIRWEGHERFRWFLSGDIRCQNHFRNIVAVCQATPEVCHWLPTREVAVVRPLEDMIPANLTVRLSAAMIDGAPPQQWEYTSTVVTDADEKTCPSSVKGGSCADNECVRCWSQQGNIAYKRH